LSCVAAGVALGFQPGGEHFAARSGAKGNAPCAPGRVYVGGGLVCAVEVIAFRLPDRAVRQVRWAWCDLRRLAFGG
jgi:hypothetical protein